MSSHGHGDSGIVTRWDGGEWAAENMKFVGEGAGRVGAVHDWAGRAGYFHSVARHFWINDLRPRLNAASHGKCVLDALRPQDGGGSQRAHAVVAIDDEAACGVGCESWAGGREDAERKPFVAGDLAEGEFVCFPAVDQARALVGRQMDPFRDRLGSDF